MNKKLIELFLNEVEDFESNRRKNRVANNLPTNHALNSDLTREGQDPQRVLSSFIKEVSPMLLHSRNPKYLGSVIGGTTFESIVADWLTTLWDQNAYVYNASPGAAEIESIVSKWLLSLLKLPVDSSVGFVTGAQAAHFTALACARDHVFMQHNWDFIENGLQGAPMIKIFLADRCHGTVDTAIKYIGLGKKNIERLSCNDNGTIDVKEASKSFDKHTGPGIVCLQAGNVNSGAFDDFKKLITLAHQKGYWVHIDGAFGLWARATTDYAYLCEGIEGADSWSVDGHKFLNVPYDSGMVCLRNEAAHQRLKNIRCAYSGTAIEGQRDCYEYVPENSRRARAFVLYVALKTLGYDGVDEMISNLCQRGQQIAHALGSIEDCIIENDVVLNIVLFSFRNKTPEYHEQFAQQIQQDGETWFSTTEWNGKKVLRICVSNYETSKGDVERIIEIIKSSLN